MKFKKISIGLIALWFLFLTAATFWSVKEENKTCLLYTSPSPVGETIEGKIEITSDDIFPKVITRQAIHEGDFGKTCVYYIKRQKGAWGYENILEEKAVTCFPNRNSDFVVLLSEVDEPMVVSTSELTNGERVKLTEKD